ncbi:MAG: hypothetical protein H0X24_16050 [Ktedonobacterales bacterium]|nr:hypothetical protein [Ktedonobacterales bacterium]
MSIVAPPAHGRNPAPVSSPAALQHLRDAMAERVTLAQSLPTAPTDSDYAAFIQCDAQVQTQIEAMACGLAVEDVPTYQ